MALAVWEVPGSGRKVGKEGKAGDALAKACKTLAPSAQVPSKILMTHCLRLGINCNYKFNVFVTVPSA